MMQLKNDAEEDNTVQWEGVEKMIGIPQYDEIIANIDTTL